MFHLYTISVWLFLSVYVVKVNVQSIISAYVWNLKLLLTKLCWSTTKLTSRNLLTTNLISTTTKAIPRYKWVGKQPSIQAYIYTAHMDTRHDHIPTYIMHSVMPKCEFYNTIQVIELLIVNMYIPCIHVYTNYINHKYEHQRLPRHINHQL